MLSKLTAIAVSLLIVAAGIWFVQQGHFGASLTGYMTIALGVIIILINIIEMVEQKVTKHIPKLAITINPETYASDVEYVSDLEFIAANAHRFHEDTVRHANLELDSRYYKQVKAINQPDPNLIHPDHKD